MFSFTRLRGADPILGVEMASTGEVACFGANKDEAFLKALLSTGFPMPEKNVLLSANEGVIDEVTHCAWQLHELGYNLFATKLTAEALQKRGVPVTLLGYPTEMGGPHPNVMDKLRSKEIDLVVNIPSHTSTRLEDNFLMRRTSVDFNIPLLTNMQLFKSFTDACDKHKKGELVGLNPHNLFEHYVKESDADAWTSPTEFH